MKKSSFRSIRRQVQKGFTLIELIIVIVIIGILAAIAIPQFTSITSSADKAALDATAANVQSAIASKFAETKAPVACNAGNITLPSNMTISGTGTCTLNYNPAKTGISAVTFTNPSGS